MRWTGGGGEDGGEIAKCDALENHDLAIGYLAD